MDGIVFSSLSAQLYFIAVVKMHGVFPLMELCMALHGTETRVHG